MPLFTKQNGVKSYYIGTCEKHQMLCSMTSSKCWLMKYKVRILQITPQGVPLSLRMSCGKRIRRNWTVALYGKEALQVVLGITCHF